MLHLTVQGKGKAVGVRITVWPQHEDYGGRLDSHEPHPGVAVQVKEGNSKSDFDGMAGVVVQRWGHDDYPALDVRLEDGRLELFWFHELERPGVGSVPYYDGS